MRDSFIKVLEQLAHENPRLALLTGDLGFSVLDNFSENYPNQFINAGVAEQNMTALACGMALSGWETYTYSIANFTTLRCLEQIRNDVCYHTANVTIVSVGGGFSYGQLGMSHFATEDLAIMRALPNMTVVAPTEKWETEDLTRELSEMAGPAYLRLDKGIGGSDRADGERAKLGKARRVREGDALTIIATGAIVKEALIAADKLSELGVNIRVLAMHTIKPLDEQAVIGAAQQTGGIITLEEHSIIGGLHGAVAEKCMQRGVFPGFFHAIGLKDIFPTVVGDQDFLRSHYKMDANAVFEVAAQFLSLDQAMF